MHPVQWKDTQPICRFSLMYHSTKILRLTQKNPQVLIAKKTGTCFLKACELMAFFHQQKKLPFKNAKKIHQTAPAVSLTI